MDRIHHPQTHRDSTGWVDVPTPEASFAEAADLANQLAELAAVYRDAKLARAATDALQLATGLRNWCAFLVEISGVEARQ